MRGRAERNRRLWKKMPQASTVGCLRSIESEPGRCRTDALDVFGSEVEKKSGPVNAEVEPVSVRNRVAPARECVRRLSRPTGS